MSRQIAAPGQPQPCSQLCQEQTLPTSGPTPSLGALVPAARPQVPALTTSGLAQAWGPSAFHSQLPHDLLHQPEAGNQPIPGASHTYQITHIACHNRKTHTTIIRGNRRAYSSGDQREVCCWNAYGVSYKRPFLQGQET